MLYLILLISLIDTTTRWSTPINVDSLFIAPIENRLTETTERRHFQIHRHMDMKNTNKEKITIAEYPDITYDLLISYLNGNSVLPDLPGNHYDEIYWYKGLLHRNAYTEELFTKVSQYFYENIINKAFDHPIDQEIFLTYLSYFVSYDYLRRFNNEYVVFSLDNYEILFNVLDSTLNIDGIFEWKDDRDTFTSDSKQIALDFCARVTLQEVPEYSIPYLNKTLGIYYNHIEQRKYEYLEIYVSNTFGAIITNVVHKHHTDIDNTEQYGEYRPSVDFYNEFFTDERFNMMVEYIRNGREMIEIDYTIAYEYMVLWYQILNMYEGYFNGELNQIIVDILNTNEYGHLVHIIPYATFANYTEEFNEIFNISEHTLGYRKYIEGDGYVYDDGKFIIKTVLDRDEMDVLYYSYNEVKAGFFNLFPGIKPLENDTNEVLNAIIFPSPLTYQYLALPVYGFDGRTNGGIFLEERGTFYTFERPDEWTLTLNDLFRHEYVHYLDGRYIKPGGYGENEFYDWDTGRYLWWAEGMAEFVSRYDMNNGFGVGIYNLEVVRDTYNQDIFNLEYSMSPDWSQGFTFYSYSSLSWNYLVHNKMDVIQRSAQMIMDGNYDGYFSLVDSVKTDETMNEGYNDMIRRVYNYQYSDDIRPSVNNEKLYPFYDIDVEIELIEGVLGRELSVVKTIPKSFIGYVDTLYSDDIISVNDSLIRITNEIKQQSNRFTGFDYVLANVVDRHNDRYIYRVFFPQFGSFNTTTNIFMDNIVDNQQVKVFPNPSTDYIVIDNVIGEQDIVIYNIMGHKVYEEVVNGTTTLNIQGFSSGVYFIKTKDRVFKITKI